MLVCLYIFLGKDDHAKALQEVKVEVMDTVTVRNIFYDYIHTNYRDKWHLG